MKLVTDPFIKNLKLRISLDQQPEVLECLFYCMSKQRSTKIY